MLARVFGSDMIFQRGRPIKIWGRGEPDGYVSAECLGKAYGTKCGQDGAFEIVLDAVDAVGAPFSITCGCGQKAQTLDNLLVGDVFLLAGQSNMEMGADMASDYLDLIDGAPPNLRFLNYNKLRIKDGVAFRSPSEYDDIPAGFAWSTVKDKEQLDKLSAAGLAFAARYYELCGVPVGLVGVAVGGTNIYSWLPRGAIEGDKGIKEFLTECGEYIEPDNFNMRGAGNHTQMTSNFNEKIAPLKGFEFRAMLWYQGESDAVSYRHTREYIGAFGLLAESYRQYLGQDLPVAAFHITAHPYDNFPYAANCINEAIDLAAQNLDGVFTVPQYDVIPVFYSRTRADEAHPIHPSNKSVYARRSADILLGRAAAPKAVRPEYGGGKAVITFDTPLKKRAVLEGFSIAGADGIFHGGRARVIDTYKVEIYSPYVAAPEAVNYAFYMYNHTANLAGVSGVPALPFRSRTEQPTADYYNHNYYLNCNRLTGYNSFYTAGSGPIKVWESGYFTARGRVKLKIVSNSEGGKVLRISLRSDITDNYFAGVSFNAAFCGCPHDLPGFKRLNISLETERGGIEFYSLIILTADSRQFSAAVCGTDGQEYLKTVLPDGKSELTLKLDRLYCGAGRVADAEENILEGARFELRFRSKTPVEIILSNLELRNR